MQPILFLRGISLRGEHEGKEFQGSSLAVGEGALELARDEEALGKAS